MKGVPFLVKTSGFAREHYEFGDVRSRRQAQRKDVGAADAFRLQRKRKRILGRRSGPSI